VYSKERYYKPLLGKKANMGDLFVIMGTIFGTAIALFIIYYVSQQINPAVQEALSTTAANESVTTILAQETAAQKLFDNVFPIFVLGLILWVIISAFYIQSNPMFFFMGIILLVIAIFIAVILANVHAELRNSPAWPVEMEEYGTTSYMVNQLPLIVLVTGLIVAVILYPKRTTGGGV